MDSRRHRRSIRLKGYDYTREGAYFITICTQDRTGLFGNVENGEMRLNEAGRMVQSVWDEMPSHYPGVDIDEFVVMPNHIHGIVILVGAMDEGQARGPAPTGGCAGLSLADVVHRFNPTYSRTP